MNKITLFLLLFCGYAVHAQLTVENTLTPAELTQTVLVGQGVTPFNITFNGSAANAVVPRDQAAKFVTNFNGSNLGLDEGLVLTTGKCKFVEAPPLPILSGGPGPANQWVSGSSAGPDADLAQLSGQTINNSVTLEFDFVATGLELNFDFVFASKEYPEYINGVNDSFGFFLSGPGITGPYSNNSTNIALVPNTALAVSIDNVNNGYMNNGLPGPTDNSQYYFNNSTIGDNPNTSSDYTVNYDGFTVGLVAKAALQCGQTYHIKLALGNAQDPLFDSAVFLKNFRIKPLVILANGQALEVCEGVEIPMAPSEPLPSTFYYVWTYNNVVISNDQVYNLPPGSPEGIYTLTYYTTSGPTGCLLGTADFDLQYLPNVLIEPDPINICSTSALPYTMGNINPTTEILNGDPDFFYDIHYYYTEAEALAPAAGPGIPISELDNYTLTSNAVTIWGRFEDLAGTGCIIVRSLEITYSANPSGNFSYPGAPYCATLGEQPITTTVTPGGTYSASPAGLNIDPDTGKITPSASTPGNYTVNYFLGASGNCPPFAPLGVSVSILALPPAPVAPTPLTYCQFETAPALTPAGTNFLWYDLPTGGVGSTTAPVPDTTVPGSKTYYVSENNGCEGPRSAVTINVNASPAIPTFTAPAAYCQNASAVPLTANETNLLWYTLPSGGVGSPLAPTPSTTTVGTTNYYVTQTISGCESQRATIPVQVLPLPLVPIPNINPVVYCEGEIPSPILITGVNLLWYTTPTGGVGSAPFPVVNTASVGSVTYYVSQTVSGCEGPRTPLVIDIVPAPTAPTVSTPLTYCQNENAPDLSLSVVGSNLLWYTDPVTGTGDPTAPIPSTLNPGPTIYYVSQSTGCESPRSAITVNVTPAPLAPTTTPITYCQNQSAAPLAITGPGTNVQWYTLPTGGTGSSTAPTPSTSTPGVALYYVTQTVNGCESARANLAVTTTPLPAAPVVTAMVGYCQGTSASALGASGSNLLWYNTVSGGAGNPTAPFPSTAAIGNTDYYVSQTVNGCEGPRSLITVEIYANPAMPTVAVTQPTCAVNSGTIFISAPLGINLEYSIDNGLTYQSGNTFNNLAGGLYGVMVRNSLTGCISASVQKSIDPARVIPAVPTAIATFQPNCITTTGTIEIAAPIGADLEYTIDGGVTYQTLTTFNGLLPNSYSLIVRNTVSGCSSAASLPIVINPIPVNPAAPTGIVIHQPTCADPTGEIQITAPIGANFDYSMDGGVTYQSQTDFEDLVPNVSYNIIVRNTITGCVSSPTAFSIIAAPTIPSTPIATATDVCVGEQINLSTPSVSGASYSWTGPNGFLSSDQNPVINNADVSMSGSYSVIISTTADCPSAPGSVNVTVNPLPLPTLYQNGYICFNTVTNTGDSYILNAGLDNTTYDFQWFVDNNGSFATIPLETQNTYSATIPGTYAVQATNSTTGCVSAMVTAPVAISSPPLQVIAVSSEYFADIQSVTVNVEPAGVYEYQIDNGAFQSSNVFNDVLPGNHELKVRNQCGESTGIAYLMDYPKFFTPNGDGYNDTWNIFALSGQANAKIYIFDRYGKLIKQISPSGKGWDGSFNEQLLPGTDYWFTVEYEENTVRKEFKSHFALKR